MTTENNHEPGAGNVELDLGEEKLILKPSYAAHAQINREIPGGLYQVYIAVGGNDINIMETVIAAAMQYTPEGRKGLGEKIFKAGTRKVNIKLQDYLAILSNGGKPLKSNTQESGENPMIESPQANTGIES